MSRIVHTSSVLTLLGGGSADHSVIQQTLVRAPILVAADGGANTAISMGLVPDAVIGDMDSISPQTRAQIPEDKFHHIAEQDSTDFEKCLQRIKAPAILALGFTGKRLDHELAACTTLVRYPDQRCILVGAEDICFLAPVNFNIDLPMGTRFSLYPMGEVQGISDGLRYPINGLEMSPATRVGTSNEVTGPVRLQFANRLMLIILPLSQLVCVLECLTQDEENSL